MPGYPLSSLHDSSFPKTPPFGVSLELPTCGRSIALFYVSVLENTHVSSLTHNLKGETPGMTKPEKRMALKFRGMASYCQLSTKQYHTPHDETKNLQQ